MTAALMQMLGAARAAGGGAGGGGVTFVQKAFGNFGASASNPLTFPGAVAPGNTVVVVIHQDNWLNDPAAFTDNQANSYGTPEIASFGVAGAGAKLLVYRLRNITNGPTVITYSLPSRASKAIAYEIAGEAAGASGIDVQSQQNSGATATPTFSFTTAVANEFAIGVIDTSSGGIGRTFASLGADVAWVHDSLASGDYTWFQHAVIPAAGVKTLDGTIGAANGAVDAWIVTYKL